MKRSAVHRAGEGGKEPRVVVKSKSGLVCVVATVVGLWTATLRAQGSELPIVEKKLAQLGEQILKHDS
ncbi:MAG: hypothetical protein RMM53_05685, partial [Bacteroidia bacterium]|nr:hypothetical protein [Bacteroidia bacterium]MDW8333686.1 hypothetical protein [Bacteroidia bacterium]